VQMW